MEAVIKFVCFLCDNKSKDADMNGLRYTLFSKKKFISWKIATNPWRINIVFEKDSLSVLYLEEYLIKSFGSPISCWKWLVYYWWYFKPEYTILRENPNKILELVSCRWQKVCKTNICACWKAWRLVCTDACMWPRWRLQRRSWF